VTDCRWSYGFCPPALLAGTTDFFDRLNELPLSAERFDIVNIADIVYVGDKRDVGIGAARD